MSQSDTIHAVWWHDIGQRVKQVTSKKDFVLVFIFYTAPASIVFIVGIQCIQYCWQMLQELARIKIIWNT